MKRLIGFLSLLCVWALGLHAQTGEFNPANPGDPNPMYRLQVQVSPASGGSANQAVTQRSPGDRIYIYVSPSSDYVFQQWVCGDSVVSTSRYFYFTMPARNVVLTAQMLYSPTPFDPPSPGDPQPVVVYHKVTLLTSPSIGGNVSESVFTLQTGDQQRIYAYPRAGYEFLGWYVGDVLLSQSNPVIVTMADEDLTYTARFRFNPASPEDPGTNRFDPTTGEVVFDRFTPNNLSDAVYSLLGNSGYENVTSLKVLGEMGTEDAYITSYFPNVTSIDLSRTTGYTSVPTRAFDGLNNLTDVMLPASVNFIDRRAFYGCPNLSNLVIYALTPPRVDQSFLQYVPESLIVQVPTGAYPLYNADPVWSQLTLHALNSRAITVELPQQTAELYRNMFLELLDTKSGQLRRYVITERPSYSYDNVFKETAYKVSVRNAQGRIMGTNEFVMPDADTTVTFAHLLQPVDINMTVVNAAGEDLTDQVTITWQDSNGEYLRKGSVLPGQLEGDQVTCVVTLSEQTGATYLQPAAQTLTISPEQPSFSITLAEPATRLLAGSVSDAATNQPIRGASIMISQVLNGKYPKVYPTQTDANGLFSTTILAASADITVSASHYSGKTVSLDSEISTLEPIMLDALSGTTIALNYRFSEAAEVGGEPVVQDWYPDYQNIDYAIYNRTQLHRILGFEVGMQQIALPNVLPDGDSVEVMVTSRNHRFAAVTIGGRVSNNRLAVTLPLTELGGINAVYNVANGGAVALLYDADGNMLKKANYADKQVVFNLLDEGDYTLVSIQESDLFSGISRLQEFANMGMEAERDFVSQPVHVANGLIATAFIDSIPVLNVPELNYIAATTSFTSNKTSIVSGSYLTLRGKLDFKAAYKDSVSNVQLIVDLPESAVLVDDAVMAGNKRVTDYTTEGRRVIIPVQNTADLIRFCVIPTQAGEFRPGAYTQFTYKGRTILQPIGSAYYKAEDASINVIINYSDMKFLVSGQTIPGSEVKIYDGDVLIGNTTVTPSGSWSTSCAIPNAYNLSVHDVYAKITTPSQFSLITQSQSVKIILSDIRLENISMSFYNSYSRENIEVVWDYLTGKTSKKSYSFYTETPFTFKVRFSNNSPQFVQSAVIKVYTDNNVVVSLPLTYDNNLDRWVARKSFGAGSLPVRVAVEASVNSEVMVDSRQVHDWLTRATVSPVVVDDNEDVMQRIQNAIDSDNFDLAASLLDSLETGVEVPDYEMTEEDIQLLLDSIDAHIGQDPLIALGYNLQTLQDSLTALTAGFTHTDCNGLTEAQLTANGYNAFPKTQGGYFYVYASDNRWEVVDFEENIHYTVSLDANPSLAAARRALASGDEDGFVHFFDELSNYINKINDVVQTLSGDVTSIQNTINKQNALIRGEQGKLQRACMVATNMETKRPLLQKRLKLLKDLKLNNTRLASIGNFRFLQVGKGFSILSVVGIFLSAVKDGLALADIYNKVLPCPEDLAKAQILRSDIARVGTAAGIYYIAQAGVAITQLLIFETSCAAALFTAGSSLTVAGVAIAALTLSYTATVIYNENFENQLTLFKTRLNSLECSSQPTPPSTPSPTQEYIRRDFPGNFDPVTPILDPSGYVYEAVNDNRVEGVQATIYYKGTRLTEGGLTEEVDVLWDAENYDQQNPLYTDAQGMYQWDVPQGLWQVRFEKEGYEPTQSDWLPVPPPQLEVNIPIVQLRQPEVLNAEAYTDAINITFDKFMLPDLLTADNIVVSDGIQVIAGSLTLLNEKKSPVEGADSIAYASRVRFVPEGGEFTAAQVTLTVSNRVRSYADVAMSETYQQTFLFDQLIPLLPAEAPVASVPAGTGLTRETELFLSSETPNAVIRYTLDGTTPDCETGLIFNPDYPILLSAQTLQVMAIACAEGYEASQVVDFQYNYNTTPTDLEGSSSKAERLPVKLLDAGHLFILLPDGTRYDATGKRVE